MKFLKKIFKKKSNPQLQSSNIAIIGMACRFPGAENYQQYWQNLSNGINSVREITPDRWDINEYYSLDANAPNKSTSKWGGLLDDIASFDANFFKISPREAQSMDPQQRLLLEETWHCIEDAGIALKDLQTSRTNVYVGAAAGDYQHYVFDLNQPLDAYGCTGNYFSILPNRLSCFFDLKGESKSIDTACSSSLVALHEARESLLQGKTDYAFVAGVYVLCHPGPHIVFSKARMLSPDGQCKTFDKTANGFVPGEGAGVLLLMSLEKALAKGHRIHGLLKGSAVNHGGASASITAPRVAAQRDVILAAQKIANVQAEQITYVEAHGTGTSLGDPIEVEGLTQAFQQTTHKTQYCGIGSVKTNIGHLEAAAGIAGVIKVVLMMQNKKIAPTLNVKTVNPLINFAHSPFYLAEKFTDWLLPSHLSHRYAGVSSFGFGGVNAHVILEEYQASTKVPSFLFSEMVGYPFLLSAKSLDSLQMLCRQWQSYVQTLAFQQQNLADMSHTLLHGREMLPYRCGFWISSHQDLIAQLQQFNTFSVTSKAIETAILWITPEIKIDYYEFDKLCQQYAGLKKNYDICCQMLVQLRQNHMVKQWRKLDKAKAPSTCFKSIVLYSMGCYLLELGLKVSLIGGSGTGQLIAAAISGYLSLEQVLQLLIGIEKKSLQKQSLQLSYHVPQVPFYDSATQTVIYPYNINANTCQQLRQELFVDGQLLQQLKMQAQALRENQFTFRQYLDDWNKTLQQENLSLDRLADTLLLQVILLTSLKQLQQKWQLTDTTLNLTPKLAAFVHIVAEGAVPHALVINWIQQTDGLVNNQLAEKLQHIILQSNVRVSIKEQFTILFSGRDLLVAPSGNIEQWLLPANEKVEMPSEFLGSTNTVLLGKHTQLTAAANFVLNISDVFSDILIKLWTHNLLDSQLRTAYDFQGQIVSLPAYPFLKNHYWISHSSKGIASLKEVMEASAG